MSTNRTEGAIRQAAGSVKKAVGKAVGNDRLRAEGAAEEAVGATQNAVGKAQDKVAAKIRS